MRRALGNGRRWHRLANLVGGRFTISGLSNGAKNPGRGRAKPARGARDRGARNATQSGGRSHPLGHGPPEPPAGAAGGGRRGEPHETSSAHDEQGSAGGREGKQAGKDPRKEKTRKRAPPAPQKAPPGEEETAPGRATDNRAEPGGGEPAPGSNATRGAPTGAGGGPPGDDDGPARRVQNAPPKGGATTELTTSTQRRAAGRGRPGKGPRGAPARPTARNATDWAQPGGCGGQRAPPASELGASRRRRASPARAITDGPLLRRGSSGARSAER